MLLSYEVGDIIKPYHNVYMNTYIYDVNYNENGRQPSLEIFQMKNEWFIYLKELVIKILGTQMPKDKVSIEAPHRLIILIVKYSLLLFIFYPRSIKIVHNVRPPVPASYVSHE